MWVMWCGNVGVIFQVPNKQDLNTEQDNTKNSVDFGVVFL